MSEAPQVHDCCDCQECQLDHAGALWGLCHSLGVGGRVLAQGSGCLHNFVPRHKPQPNKESTP